MIAVRRSPGFISAISWSQPAITAPVPSVNSKGVPRSRELSNFEPSSSQPV